MNAEIVYKGPRRKFEFRYSGPEWVFLITALCLGIGVVAAVIIGMRL
jgi:hypothetical protein